MDENNKMNTGAEDAPDAETQLWLSREEQPYVYLNMREGYTQGNYQWGCQSVYPAGGMLAFNVNNDGGGRINTPMFDLTANDGISILHFRARTKKCSGKRMCEYCRWRHSCIFDL